MWSMLESFAGPLFSLMLIPVLTQSLGLEGYGLYVMVMAFVALFSFVGMGMNTSVTYYMAVNYQTSNSKDIAERVGTALAISLLGTITFSLLFLFALTFFSAYFQNVSPQLIKQTTLIYAALLLLIFSQCDSVISATLKGLQQFKTSSKLEFLIRLISFISIAFIATMQKNVNLIISSSVVIALLSLLIRYLTLNKLVSISFKHLKINKKFISELFYFGKWMTLQNVSGAVFGSLDKLMLGFFFNTAVVGTYNIIISITQLSHYIISSAFSFILPKICASAANLKTLQKYYYKSLIISALVALIMMSFLSILYPYIKSHFNLGDIKSEFFILLFSYGALAMSVSPYYFSLGFGKVKLLSSINTISANVS